MHIGIDISQIVYEGTGVARFTKGLVQAILRYDTTNTWTFFASSFRKQLPEDIKQAIQQSPHTLTQLPLAPSALSYLWNDLHVLPVSTLIPKLDWFITSDWTEPPADCKKATIVHDLAFRRFPETIDPTIMKVFQKKLEHVKKESNVIFADSASTKEDLETFYGITGNVVVNYPGVEVTKPTKAHIAAVQKKYGLSDYIISVGKIEPRKNLKRLIEAYNNIKDPAFQLVLVGPKGWEQLTIDNKNIHMLGFVPDDDLYALYAGSKGLILPSLWEGFGYPAVEAMLLDVPVAVSNRSSLAEIVDNTGITFNPEDTASIQKGMIDLVAKQSSTKAVNRAKMFSWENYITNMGRTLEKYK